MASLKIHKGDILYPTVFAQLQNELSILGSTGQPEPPFEFGITYENTHQTLNHWVMVAETTEKTMVDVLAARSKAIMFGAENLTGMVFQNAEQKLRGAAEQYYQQNERSSKTAREARVLYENATREAIRNQLLGQTKIILYESESLGARTVAPQSFSKATALLADVESMLNTKNTQNQTLFQKSAALQERTRELQLLVKTIKPMLASPKDIENFVLDLNSYIQKIGDELNAPIQQLGGLQDLFRQLLIAANNLNTDNQRLHSRNTDLTAENVNLELALTNYRSIAARRESVQRKVEKLRSFNIGGIEQRNGFITIRMDSIAFESEYYDINPQNARRLNRVLGALNEFTEYPVIVRYVQFASQNVYHDQQLATMRAESIRDHLQSHDANPKRDIQALGLVFKSPQSDSDDNGQLEILIDLEGILTHLQQDQP